MRKITLFGKKTFVILGLCAGITGLIYFANKPATIAAADSENIETDIDVSYAACENNDEEILYEDVDEEISTQVIQMEDAGEVYDISDEIELKDGYYIEIAKEDGYSIVAGVSIEGKNYVVTMNAQDQISTEAVEKVIEDIQPE